MVATASIHCEQPTIHTIVSRPLANALPEIVAQALNLSSHDVQVQVLPSAFNNNRYPLFIDILTEDNPIYTDTRDIRRSLIADGIRGNLPADLIGKNKVYLRVVFAPVSSQII